MVYMCMYIFILLSYVYCAIKIKGGGGASVSIRSLHLACNAELSPERYWRGPGAQKVGGGGEGVQYPTPTLSPAE